MRKQYIIFERTPNQDGSYTIQKWYSLGKKNFFHTINEVELFITDIENYKLFNLECEYIILPVFTKEVFKVQTENPCNYA